MVNLMLKDTQPMAKVSEQHLHEEVAFASSAGKWALCGCSGKPEGSPT